LGLHFTVYESLFTAFHSFWQYDHATAHNTWLHVWVEQGPVAFGLLAFGALALLGLGWRGFRRSKGKRRLALGLVGLALVGVLVESLAQYLAYVRVVEVFVWVMVGSLVGLLRKGLGPVSESLERPVSVPSGESSGEAEADSAGPGFPRWLGWAVLGVAGAGAIWVGESHAARWARLPPPRNLAGDMVEGLHVWTGSAWRFPVDPRWCGVEFMVHAKAVPQEIEVQAPWNRPVRLRLAPGKDRDVRFTWPARESVRPWTSLRWVKVEGARTWVPAVLEPGSEDRRALGVYIHRLRALGCEEGSGASAAVSGR
jgi:hypothetical protein